MPKIFPVPDFCVLNAIIPVSRFDSVRVIPVLDALLSLVPPSGLVWAVEKTLNVIILEKIF